MQESYSSVHFFAIFASVPPIGLLWTSVRVIDLLSCLNHYLTTSSSVRARELCAFLTECLAV